LSQSCIKPKPFTPAITTTIPVPQDVMDYFVNYDVGTCWVYQDSINPANFDTIELTQILHSGFNNDRDTLFDEYSLFFQPHKTSAFWVWISASRNNNSYEIQIVPVTPYAAGELDVAEQNGTWYGGVYQDSLRIMNKTYYQTLEIYQYNVICFFNFIYAKNIGLVSYENWGQPRVKGSGGNYKFVKKFKK